MNKKTIKKKTNKQTTTKQTKSATTCNSWIGGDAIRQLL